MEENKSLSKEGKSFDLMTQIPNFFTLLNLVFGCLAIITILQNGIAISGNDEGATWIDIPESIWYASLFIGLAAIVDFLDGFVARIFKATSEMGKQLDSLADVISFGVAPGMIIYQFLRLSLAKEVNGLNTSIIWVLPAFFIPCAAAWRLARFNLDTTQSYSFKGLPVPAAGLFIASFPLIYWNVNESWVRDWLLNKWFLYAVVVIISWLMISTIPLMSLKIKDFSLKSNLSKLILIIVAIGAIIFFQWLSAPIIVLAYVLISLLFKNKPA